MANTLKFGNGEWATKEGSTLAYNDENGNFKPLPFTFDRSTSATRVNKEGLIEVVSNNEPRIDFLNDSKGALLLEPSRTNSFLYSNQFDTTWNLNYLVLTGGQIGINGDNDAWLVSGFSGTGEKRLRQNPNLVGNTAISVYAKKGTNDFLWLRGVTDGFNKRTFFNLSNGTIGQDGAASSNMIDMGNGWYRCEAVFNQSSGFDFYIGLSDSNGASTTSTTGNIYIQYAQAEQGSYATSYIPTQGSIGTRVAESCSDAGNDQVFNDSEGVLFAEISALADDGTARRIYINNSDNSKNMLLEFSSTTNQIRAVLFNGSTQADLSTTTYNQIDNNKIAFKYKASNFALWVDGIEVDSQVGSGTTFNNGDLERMLFSYVSSVNFYGNTKQIKYFNEALTDAELAALTKI